MATASVGASSAHQASRPALFSDAPVIGDYHEENLSSRSENSGLRNLGLRGVSAPPVATLESAPSGNSSGSTAGAGHYHLIQTPASTGNVYRSTLTDAYGMPSSSESLRYVTVATRGLATGVPDPTRRQLEALEDRLGASIASLCRQQTADRQEADRLADLSSGRLVARVDRSEQQQARLERRISELAGLIKGFDDEAQTREARSEQLHERVRSLQASLKQEQESLHKRLCDLEQDQQSAMASFRTAAHANEDSHRHSTTKMRQVETQIEEHGRSLDALGRETRTLHERIDGLESMSCRNADASLAVTCDQEILEAIPGHTFSIGKAEDRDGWTPRDHAAGEEAFLAMQEIEAVHQQLQTLQERCSFVQEVVDERLTSQLRRLERKVGDHEMKVDQLLSDGQDCSAKVEEHEVRLGVTRSKLDAQDQRLALINDRLDRVLKLERASNGFDIPGSRNSLQSEESRCRELRELRDRVETSLVTFSEKASPALQEMRELRGRVESCEQQLSSSALASTCSLGASDDSSALRGSLPLPPSLERRLLSWETTLNDLSDRFGQHSSAFARDNSLAEKAMKQADAATLGLEDLAVKISKLAKLGEVSRSGFKDVSGHLEAVSEQFGQLRERVQQHEEHLVASSGSSLKSEEFMRVQEQTSQNAMMISTLSRSIFCVQEMLSEVKKTLDIALAERIGNVDKAVVVRNVATVQPASHISQEFITRTEESVGKAMERAREAEARTSEIEQVVTSLQMALDTRARQEASELTSRSKDDDNQAWESMRSEVMGLAGKFEAWTSQWSLLITAAGLGVETDASAFESIGKVLQTVPEQKQDQENQASAVALMRSEVTSLSAQLGALTMQWRSMVTSAGLDDSNVTEFENLGKRLSHNNQAAMVADVKAEIVGLTTKLEGDIKTQGQSIGSHADSLQRVDAAIDEIFARLNSREGEESGQHAILTRLEHAERALEEQRQISQALEQQFVHGAEHHTMLTRLEQTERALEEQRQFNQVLEQPLEQGAEAAGGRRSLNHVHPPEVGGGGHNHSFVMQGEVAGGGPVSHVAPPNIPAVRPNNLPAEAEMSAGLYGMTRRAETEAETSAGPFPSPAQVHRFQGDMPQRQLGEDETSESHVTGGDGAGGTSPNHVPTTPTTRNLISQVGLFAEGDGAGGPNAIRTLESTLAEADGGGGRSIVVSTAATDFILGGNGDEGGGNEGRNDMTNNDVHVDRGSHDNDGPRASLVHATSAVASTDADLDMLFEDLTGAEMAGGGPGRQNALGTPTSGGDPTLNAVSSQAASSDIQTEPSRWNHVLGDIQSRWRSSPSKLDRDEFQSPGSQSSSKSQFASEAAALARWNRFSASLLERVQSDEPVVDSPTSQRAPVRKSSGHFALSGPAVSQRGDLLPDPANSFNNSRPGSWPGAFTPCRIFGSDLHMEQTPTTSPTAAKFEGEIASQKEELVQDCSPQSIKDEGGEIEWIVDSTNNAMPARGTHVESLDGLSMDGKSRRKVDEPNDVVAEMCSSQHEQQHGRVTIHETLAPTSSPSAHVVSNGRSATCEDTTISSFALDESEDPLAHLGIGDSDDGASSDSIVEDIDEELLDDSNEVASLQPQAPNAHADDIAAVDIDGDSSDDEKVETQQAPVRRSLDAVTAGIASTFPDLVIDTFEEDESSPEGASLAHFRNLGATSSHAEAVAPVTTEIVETSSLVKGGMNDASDDSEESDAGESSDGYV